MRFLSVTSPKGNIKQSTSAQTFDQRFISDQCEAKEIVLPSSVHLNQCIHPYSYQTYGRPPSGPRNINDFLVHNMTERLTSNWSCSLLFFFIICKNSGKSIVPSPFRSTSMTSSRTSSSVGFWPIDLITPSNSLVEIEPLPSWNRFAEVSVIALLHQKLLKSYGICFLHF